MASRLKDHNELSGGLLQTFGKDSRTPRCSRMNNKFSLVRILRSIPDGIKDACNQSARKGVQ